VGRGYTLSRQKRGILHQALIAASAKSVKPWSMNWTQVLHMFFSHITRNADLVEFGRNNILSGIFCALEFGNVYYTVSLGLVLRE